MNNFILAKVEYKSNIKKKKAFS